MKLSEYLSTHGDRTIDPVKLDELFKTARDPRFYAGQPIFYLDCDGDVTPETWDGSSYDIACEAQGNCFETRALALHEGEKRKIMATLKRMADDAGGVNWSDTFTDKWCIIYDHTRRKVLPDEWTNTQITGVSYFPSIESARAAIADIGEANILKYLFDMEVGADDRD